MIGQTISHYKILEKLGEGGMGVVYKAQDTKLDRIVALKFLPARLSASEEDKSRFMQEAKAASALNHPHVCNIHSIGEHEGQSFIDMEFVEGQTLRAKVAGRLPKLDEAAAYAIQIGEALQEAHTKNIVHRDIKSENIMVNSKNQIKVMDFGLAKLKGSMKLTRTSSTVGTLAYMAPEQIQGGEVDARSDIFSFGIVLFEMLTGQFPFRGEHDAAMMYSILNEKPESPRIYVSDIPEAFERIIEKALEKNPDERYQSIADLVADLRRWKRDSAGTSRVESGAFKSMVRSATVPVQPQRRSKKWWLVGGILGIGIIAAAIFLLRPADSGSSSEKKTLAVIPFTNQSEPEREYFADGIAEEITTRLSSLSGIGVIARASAWQYKGTKKSVKEIGEELGIDYVLMGTVRWSGGDDQALQVRVRPELIDVRSGLQVWANTFDTPFKNAFAIQSDIAQQVAQALNLNLLSPEASALQHKLTSNAEAYDYYLKGFEYVNRSSSKSDREIGIEQFERAVALDPSFAAAYAQMGAAHASMYWFFYDRSQERVEKARIAAEKALALAPNLSVSHEAMGWFHYHTRLDYDAAIKEFSIALDLQPNNPDVSYGMAAVYRRQGKMSESVEQWKKTLANNPRASEIERQLGETLTLERKYEEADEHYRNVIGLAPDNATVHGQRALNLLLWKGDLRAATEAVDKGMRYGRSTSSEDRLLFYMEYKIALSTEDFAAAERAVGRMETTFGMDNQFVYYPRSLLLAQIEDLKGSSARARILYQSSLDTIQQRLKENPDDERAYSAIGIAYAGLGRVEEAVRAGERGRDLLPVEKEAWRGSYRLIDLAHIYTIIGDQDKAIDVLKRLLTIPSDLSGHWVKLDARWKPLRGNKRFQALVESHL